MQEKSHIRRKLVGGLRGSSTTRQGKRDSLEYRLGNRSALEWIIDQYQVSTDKRNGITNDPNRADDLQYIVRLIGQVITISLETTKLTQSLSTKLISETT